MVRRTFLATTIVAVMFMFQGCMPVTKPFVPAKIEANKALIYVYRPESFVARGSTWSINANGKVISTYFINNGYIPIYVEPGNIELELYHKNIGFASNVYSTVMINNVKAGTTSYIKAFMKFGGNPHFEVMDKDTGLKEIKNALYFEDQMK